jgi:hypothetical protein
MNRSYRCDRPLPPLDMVAVRMVVVVEFGNPWRDRLRAPGDANHRFLPWRPLTPHKERQVTLTIRHQSSQANARFAFMRLDGADADRGFSIL